MLPRVGSGDAVTDDGLPLPLFLGNLGIAGIDERSLAL